MLLSTKRYKLEPGESTVIEVIGEGYLHPLVGSGICDEIEFGGRKNVFEPPLCGLLLGHGEYAVKAVGRPLDFILACAHKAEPVTGMQVISPDEEYVIGKGTHRRTVRVILGHGGPSQKLRVGETVNRRGGWSSWPPHSFDKNPENAKQFEEDFYCFTDPKDGEAYLVRNGLFPTGPDFNDIARVVSGDCYRIPLGYHPIVGGPGTKLMYVWFYVSPEDKIYPKWAEDLGGYK